MDRSISKLKEQARHHEQEGKWAEAIRVYKEVQRLEEEEGGEGELSLLNRIGDLYLRSGDEAAAIRYYELAADRYEAAGLYNSAVALCNKVIRQDPARAESYQRLARLALAQGFVSEARRCAIEYAERLLEAGRQGEAFEALTDFANRAGDPEIRESLADYLVERGAKVEALPQLMEAYRECLRIDDRERTGALAEKILALDPTIDLSSIEDSIRSEEPMATGGTDWEVAEPDHFESASQGTDPAGTDDWGEDHSESGPLVPLDPGTEESYTGTEGEVEVELGLQSAAESAGIDLDGLEVVGADDLVELVDLEPMPTAEADEAVEMVPESLPDSGVDEEAMAEALLAAATLYDDVAETDDPITPEVAGTGFVDFGALLGEWVEAEPGLTRYVVDPGTPSGDEDRDLLEVLSQFKSKVAEHLGEDDAQSHYDLGLAFKGMGLYDEAIVQFQAALRGLEDHLKIHEELGHCFFLKERYTIALKILQRALRLAPPDAGAELIGLHYQIGRSHEELGQVDEAREAYERVIAFDLEFRDTAARLEQL